MNDFIFPSTIIVGLEESEAKQMYSAVMEEFAKFVEQVPGVKVLWDGGCEKWDVVDAEVVDDEPLDETHAVYWCDVCERDVDTIHFALRHKDEEPDYSPDDVDPRDADDQAIIAGNRYEAGGCR